MLSIRDRVIGAVVKFLLAISNATVRPALQRIPAKMHPTSFTRRRR